LTDLYIPRTTNNATAIPTDICGSIIAVNNTSCRE